MTDDNSVSYFVLLFGRQNRNGSCFQLGYMNDHLFWKEAVNSICFVWLSRNFTNFLCASFPFGFEGGMWNLIVADHCPSFYFLYVSRCRIETRN